MILAVCLILSCIVAYALAAPLFVPVDCELTAAGTQEAEHKQRLVQVLLELELDRATDKLDQQEYERTKRSLEGELAQVLIRTEQKNMEQK